MSRQTESRIPVDEKFVRKILARSNTWTSNSNGIEWCTVWTGRPLSKNGVFVIGDFFEMPVYDLGQNRGVSMILDHVLGIAEKHWVVAVHHIHPDSNLDPSSADFVTFVYLDILMRRPLLYVISNKQEEYSTLMFSQCHECSRSFFKFFIEKQDSVKKTNGEKPREIALKMDDTTFARLEDRWEVWCRINKVEWAAALIGEKNVDVQDFFELPFFNLSRRKNLPTFLDDVVRIDKAHRVVGLIQSNPEGRLFPTSADFATWVYMEAALRRPLKFVMYSSERFEIYTLSRCSECPLNSFFEKLGSGTRVDETAKEVKRRWEQLR